LLNTVSFPLLPLPILVSLPDLNHSFLPLAFSRSFSQFSIVLVNLFLRLSFSVGFRRSLFLSLPPASLVSDEHHLLVVSHFSLWLGRLLFLSDFLLLLQLDACPKSTCQ
jgi:hypothetical protein